MTRSDYIVTRTITLYARVENADDAEQAASIAADWMDEQNVRPLVADALDLTAWYVGADGPTTTEETAE